MNPSIGSGDQTECIENLDILTANHSINNRAPIPHWELTDCKHIFRDIILFLREETEFGNTNMVLSKK